MLEEKLLKLNFSSDSIKLKHRQNHRGEKTCLIDCFRFSAPGFNHISALYSLFLQGNHSGFRIFITISQNHSIHFGNRITEPVNLQEKHNPVIIN